MVNTWLDFGEVLLNILNKFSFKKSDVFYKVKHYFGHISGMVGPIDLKKKVQWLDTGYNMWYGLLTSLMTLTLDVSRSNFEIASSHELLVWLMWNEKEVS